MYYLDSFLGLGEAFLVYNISVESEEPPSPFAGTLIHHTSQDTNSVVMFMVSRVCVYSTSQV